jgi:RNA polymerase sigma factor (sigma-70 family)
MHIDERLINDCIRGDRKSQLQLYDRCYPYLMSICMRYCKDSQEAGSGLNLAFLKILQHLHTYEHTGSFKAWISRITVRSLIDEFRAQQKHYKQHEYSGELGYYHDWPEEMNRLAETIDLEYLMAIINQLPAMEKQVFNLFIIDGYSHREIATMLQISEGTSKWHVHQARKKLQEKLMPTANKATVL